MTVTNPTRTIQDQTLGTITVHVDADELLRGTVTDLGGNMTTLRYLPHVTLKSPTLKFWYLFRPRRTK